MTRKISVFIASPGDLASERKAFREAIDKLNDGFADGAGVEFEALGWEDTLASTGRRNQSVINEDIDRCDVFLLVMHRRWGQEAPDAKPYLSYTEEEFHRALERWKQDKKPEIFVFFKRVDPASEADPGPQLQKVMAFRQQLEETRQVLYRPFADDQSFTDEVDRHLRAYVKGELPKTEQNPELVVLPLDALKQVEEAKTLALQKEQEAIQARDAELQHRMKIEAMQLQLAQDAAELSKQGKIEYARQKFAGLVTETDNLDVLSLGYEFYYRTGDLDAAFSVVEKWLDLCDPDSDSSAKAGAYNSLGNLYRTRGELEQAEQMYQQALALFEALGHKGGMAGNYGNLGILYKNRGELEQAEQMYQQALALFEALGHKEGIANQYGNLGVLYRTLGELECAKQTHQDALEIYEELGHKEGMAKAYANLGIVYQKQDELERAKKMYHKALALNEELGRKEGMAKQYGNLGGIYKDQGDLKRAEQMVQKALALNEELGRKEGMAKQYGNLGNLYQTQGELERADAMYQKSLHLFKALQSPHAETVANWLDELREIDPEDQTEQ